MNRSFRSVTHFGFLSFLLVSMTNLPVHAQLNTTFDSIFNEILVNRLQLSPGAHGNHYREAAMLAASQLTPSLNSLIASNVSSFPNSATSVGVTFSFEGGAPQKIRQAEGPIFGEMATTQGKGVFNLGMNASHLSLDKFRGLDTEDMRFTFPHVDVTGDGTLGENPNESDTIDVTMGIDVDATIYNFYATYGITDRVDVTIGVPVIDVSLTGTAVASVNSFTIAALGEANHHFGDDATRPVLQTAVPYSDSAAGIGDATIRFKYNAFRNDRFGLGFILEYRLATGDEDDYLGTGENEIRLSQIFSGERESFSWHLNLSFERRPADLDSDEFEYLAGFNYEVGGGLAWTMEVLGEYDLNDKETIELLPGTVTITDRSGDATNTRIVELSNIPERDNDNTLSGSIGVRFAPSDRLVLIANVLLPLNDGGLRSDVVGTAGVGYTF